VRKALPTEPLSRSPILRPCSKRAGLTVLALLILHVLPMAVFGHQGSVVFPIYELPTGDLPDLHDGTLEEWETALPGASLDHNQFMRVGGSVDTEDLAFRVFLAWHHVSQRLFIAVERVDDVYVATGDGMGFFVDGDHSGGPYESTGNSDASRGFNHSQAQSYLITPEPRESSDTPLMETGPAGQWVSLSPWADAGGFELSEEPNISGTEFFITPWDVLDWRGPETSRSSLLQPGHFIGFEISILDIDEPPDSGVGSLQGLYVLSGVQNYPGTADLFADGELIPCDRQDCSGAGRTSVGQNSWARIKATFR